MHVPFPPFSLNGHFPLRNHILYFLPPNAHSYESGFVLHGDIPGANWLIYFFSRFRLNGESPLPLTAQLGSALISPRLREGKYSKSNAVLMKMITTESRRVGEGRKPKRGKAKIKGEFSTNKDFSQLPRACCSPPFYVRENISMFRATQRK